MKPAIQSKTIIFFVLSLLVAIAGYFGYADFIPEEAFGPIGGAIMAIVGIILRVVTDKEVMGVLKS